MPEYLMITANDSHPYDSEPYLLIYDANEVRDLAHRFKTTPFPPGVGLSARIDPVMVYPLNAFTVSKLTSPEAPPWLASLIEAFSDGEAWIQLIPADQADEFDRFEQNLRQEIVDTYSAYALQTPESSLLTFFVSIEDSPIISFALTYEEIDNPPKLDQLAAAN